MKPIRQFFLEANPNPERQGCPDEKTLKDIAENRLPADHPARLHLASCSPCFAEFRSFKGQFETKSASRRRILAWGIAACLLVAVGLFRVKAIIKKSDGNVATSQAQKQGAELAAVDRTIDLFNHGTVRGGADPNPLEAVSLPSSLVHLHLILPRFSDAGSYVVAVTRDRAGTAIVARGTGKTRGDGQRLLLDVSLDLRGAQAGSYFLATVRESDNGTYYYPLNVQGR
ncbi:MAG TPA: hypothetical protein VGR47_22420 [Terracidiphilus sp.]|nr:hypothetical protein [Terracidiphilus sp.]